MEDSSRPPAPDSGPDPRAALERELYWAEEGSSLGGKSTVELRDALHDFTTLLRSDERTMIPRGEPNLGATSKWRRRTKLGLFAFLRPLFRRYDRLTGDLAELATHLADRLVATEAEVARLRAKLEGPGSGGTGDADG